MPIDTAQKRQSAGFNIPGLMVPPFPNGSISTQDRIQMADEYTGITIQGPLVPPNSTLWVIQRNAGSIWKATSDLSNVWKGEQRSPRSFVKENDSSSNWGRENRLPETFVPEGEVFPKEDL